MQIRIRAITTGTANFDARLHACIPLDRLAKPVEFAVSPIDNTIRSDTAALWVFHEDVGILLVKGRDRTSVAKASPSLTVSSSGAASTCAPCASSCAMRAPSTLRSSAFRNPRIALSRPADGVGAFEGQGFGHYN